MSTTVFPLFQDIIKHMVSEIFNNPVMQSGIVPFCVAAITAKALGYSRLSGLAVVAGFCATVFLISDFDFENLSVIKKIILSGLVTAFFASALDLLPFGKEQWRRHVIMIGCAGVTLWVFSTVLRHRDISEMVLAGFGMIGFIVLLSLLMDNLSSKPIRAGIAGMGLGLGVGFSAVLSSSALLGQLGLSVGVAACAYVLINLLNRKLLSCGRIFTLPVSLLSGLIALAAVMLAKLPWFYLPILFIIPGIAHVPLPPQWPPRIQAMILFLLTLISGAIPVLLILYDQGGLQV